MYIVHTNERTNEVKEKPIKTNQQLPKEIVTIVKLRERDKVKLNKWLLHLITKEGFHFANQLNSYTQTVSTSPSERTFIGCLFGSGNLHAITTDPFDNSLSNFSSNLNIISSTPNITQ